MRYILINRWSKTSVFVLCLVPALWLGWIALNGDLGANPIEFITHRTGDWTIRFLCITLSITPLRKLLALPEIIRFRRMLGLFGFFYAGLHFLTWLVLDKLFDWNEIARDVVKRPFITAGFIAFLLLIPLAITSTTGWIRRLGGKRWQTLHRLIYVSACAAVVHYYWLRQVGHPVAVAVWSASDCSPGVPGSCKPDEERQVGAGRHQIWIGASV